MKPTSLLCLMMSGMAMGANHPTPVEDDFLLKEFRFHTGESLPELKLHYRTIGSPSRDASGSVNNAVLVLHGTGGSGANFITREAFSGELFGPGQPLDATKYYLIVPDNIGHGQSSKPSDGLRTGFPKYGYLDMVESQRRLLNEKLGVRRLRLVLGTSMGCMHAWLWGTMYPDAVDALLPLACLPHEISGRNLIWRKMIVDLIRNDPGYNNGNYTTQPSASGANYVGLLMTQNTLYLQKQAPTREDSVKLYAQLTGENAPRAGDANDRIYQSESSSDYNPLPHLEKIKAAVYAVNFADDPINPPELGILEREIRRVPRGRAVVVPASEETRGHGTHSLPKFWKQYLVETLRMSDPPSAK